MISFQSCWLGTHPGQLLQSPQSGVPEQGLGILASLVWGREEEDGYGEKAALMQAATTAEKNCSVATS